MYRDGRYRLKLISWNYIHVFFAVIIKMTIWKYYHLTLSFLSTRHISIQSCDLYKHTNLKKQKQIQSRLWVDILEETYFSGTNSFSLLCPFSGASPFIKLLLVQHVTVNGEMPTLWHVCKHVINYIINNMRWQSLIMLRNCTGSEYGTLVSKITYVGLLQAILFRCCIKDCN